MSAYPVGYSTNHRVLVVYEKNIEKGDTMNIEDFIDYIDSRLDAEDHGESFWVNDLGARISADYGYAYSWWHDCMRPELLRHFGEDQD
jgi:hypothetical protein